MSVTAVVGRFAERAPFEAAVKELRAADFEESDLSALRIAEKVLWPELTPADLQTLYRTRHNDTLKRDDAKAILDVSGGEPRLAASCCEFHHEHGPDYARDDLAAHLFDSDMFWYLVRSTASNAGDDGMLSDAFGRGDLGPGVGYPLALPQRRLFWRNLLTRRRVGTRKRLVWRSEGLRQAGQEILACA